MATANVTAAGQYTDYEDSPVTAGTTLFSVIIKPGPWRGNIQVQAKVRGDADTLVVDVGSPLHSPTLVNIVLPNGFSVRAGVKGGDVTGTIPIEVIQS